MAAQPGDYPLVVPAPERKTSDIYSFDNECVCIPLVSSSGHGKSDIKRLHYQEGKFALADTMCCITVRDKNKLRPRYVYEILSTYKDDWIVPLMSGATNVTLDPNDLKRIVIPIPSPEKQDSIIEGIALGQMIQQLVVIKQAMLGKTTHSEKNTLLNVINSLQEKRNRCISLDSVWIP